MAMRVRTEIGAADNGGEPMQSWKRNGIAVALVVMVIVLLSMMTVQAQAQTTPVMPGLACEGVASVEQLKNAKAVAEKIAGLRLDWMKNSSSLFLDGETSSPGNVCCA